MLPPYHDSLGTGESLTEHQYLKLPAQDGDFPPPIKKPTLGVMPRRVWLHQRAVALTQAINRYTTNAEYASAYTMIDELDEILDELRLRPDKQDK